MTDELSGGRERRRVPRRAAAVLVVALFAGGTGDRWLQHRESAALMRCVESGEAVVEYVDRRIAATISFASPQLFRACSRVSVLPWHQSTRAAARAFVAYLDSCDAHLDRAARDASTLGTRDEVRGRARTQARRRLLEAVAGADSARVEELLSP